jgi:hypothetical protein
MKHKKFDNYIVTKKPLIIMTRNLSTMNFRIEDDSLGIHVSHIYILPNTTTLIMYKCKIKNECNDKIMTQLRIMKRPA